MQFFPILCHDTPLAELCNIQADFLLKLAPDESLSSMKVLQYFRFFYIFQPQNCCKNFYTFMDEEYIEFSEDILTFLWSKRLVDNLIPCAIAA